MAFEGFFKKVGKKVEKMDDFTKIVLTAGTAAAAAGAIAGTETYRHEAHMEPNAQMPNFDTMPLDHEDPTLGKTAGDGPDPIVVPSPEGHHVP